MHMDRAIFDLKASVEATSLYILLCALLDQGEPTSIERARVQWNGTEDGLIRAAQELMIRGVLELRNPLSEKTVLTLNPKGQWR